MEYTVVASSVGDLSIWPAGRPVPASWRETGDRGSADACLETIARIAPPLIGPGRPPAGDGGEKSLLRLFAASCHRYPGRTAVSDGPRSMTYAQLDLASDTVAASLRRHGLAREDRVAVYLPRGADVFVALLGILKADGAYVPIDTMYSAARRDLMIRASGACVTITTPGLLAGLQGPGLAGVTMDQLIAGPPPDRDQSPVAGKAPGEPAGSQAACVLFTSGSTGQPKAVVLEHRNIVYFACNTALPALRPDDRVAHVSSLSFDPFHLETWCTLAAGAQVVVLPAMAQLVEGDVGQALRRHEITAMVAPTMAVNHVVRADPESFSSLRLLHTGGDVILPGACRDLLASSFTGRFYNLYGPTECTTACTGYHIADVPPEADSVPIGTALHDARAYVLDSGGQLVPDGAIGELHVGGAGVARGYLGMPAETASKFLPDPFAAADGRMYRTGDLVRRRPDGVLEFVSRVDDQVKIRGYRVEPREVERVLLRNEAVLDAAVIAEGDVDNRHLVALVAGGATLSLRDLRQKMADTLPHYMVPTVMLAVDKIPANAHGKRDSATLRQLARSELERRRTIVPPRDDLERRLADVWRELLAVEEVGLEDDFYALGGNSMLAFRLRQRLTRDLGVVLEMRDVLGTPVLGGLAELVRARKPSAAP